MRAPSLEAELSSTNSFRRIKIPPSALFPRIDTERFRSEMAPYEVLHHPHQTIANVVQGLQDPKTGYKKMFEQYGFWEQGNEKFTGQCHQITPALAVGLWSLGFDANYLECFRIDERDWKHRGVVEKMDPLEESDPEKRKEFERIGRIPFCVVKVYASGMRGPRLISGKHIKDNQSLLLPECHEYSQNREVVLHQDDPIRSGVYLGYQQQEWIRSNGVSFGPAVWMKHASKDKEKRPEFFASFLEMKIV